MSKEEFLKIIKNKNNRLICIILIIGVVFMVAAGESKSRKGDSADMPSAETVYQQDEEARLAGILSRIDGAGEVSVMITYYSSAEKSIAYETKRNIAQREDKSEQSEDNKAVMTDGEPLVVKEVYPSVKGVIITAQGAGNTAVRSAISSAVAAALDVPAHRICIFESNK